MNSRDHLHILDTNLSSTELGKQIRTRGDRVNVAGISAETAVLIVACQGLIAVVRELVAETENLRARLADKANRPPL